jgi:hypothetical protein
MVDLLNPRNHSRGPAIAICRTLAAGNIQELTGGGATVLEVPGILDRQISRRDFLNVTRYGATASLLNQSVLGQRAESAFNPIRSCILVMLYGGPSHLDTWDMKTLAPIEIRGEYQPIQTSLPGRVVCEHLPLCARLIDRLAVVRSMHHGMSNHNSAMYQALAGRQPRIDLDVLGANRAEDFPGFGSALSYVTDAEQTESRSDSLTNVALPHVMHNVVDLPGQNAGFLGGGHDPLQITHDPNRTDFHVPNLRLPPGVNEHRMERRLSLLQSLQRELTSTNEDSIDAYRQRAQELLHSETVQRAFRIDQEPDRVRNRYGRNTLGQSLLLARKLVEADVRFINVNDKVYNGQDANWDSHSNVFPRHRELLPPFDQGFSALIEDLADRGLLESTLVVVTGEFGRTPRINANAGRDHWPDCYSVVLAGGGVAAGSTYGTSDRSGAYPLTDAVTPGDLAATLFWRFGIDAGHEIHDPLGRPSPLAEGRPIRRLFGGFAQG